MEQIFKDNPKLDIAYKTADGKFFFLENDAHNHASTLENKKVVKVEKGNVSQEKTEEKVLETDKINSGKEVKNLATSSAKNFKKQ